MRALAFRHVPFEHLGLIADSLREHTIEYRYADLYQDPRPRAVEEADGLIFMGGPMSVNDDLPYIRQELRLIEEAVARGKPVLGVCLGAQLIAKALGSRVYRTRPRRSVGIRCGLPKRRKRIICSPAFPRPS
jgi:GMP synthase (glutamine-hydrolysing)